MTHLFGSKKVSNNRKWHCRHHTVSKSGLEEEEKESEFRIALMEVDEKLARL